MVVEGEYYDGPCKLLELPHYVLRVLFSYLDATSLYNLSRTCNYMKEFIFDPLFWRKIDARDDPNICDKIEYCTRRVHKKTTCFCIRGNLTFIDLPADFFTTVKPFENIKVLALENIKLKGSKVALKDFPSGLEELSLRKTYIKDSDYFFQHSVKNLPKLRVLILDECSWVTCSFLLSVSKYENLEIISIVKCLRVHMNMIPYLNVAKLGCKKLKIFDCRFTGIGGELLRTFYSKDNLQRLYFQSFKSAEIDYQEKIFDYSQKGKKKPTVEPNTDMSISDIHLCEYLTTTAKPKHDVEKIGNSVLYKDPYPECTCGREGPEEDELRTNVTVYDDDLVHIPSGRGEPKFVCNRHMKDIVNLPKNFKDFFLSQQQLINPASDLYLNSDSNSDDDDDDNNEEGDGGCCYFGMGTSLIVPSTHDRIPSAGEEMTLPDEGARNQSFPRVYVFNSNRDNGNIKERRSNSDHSSNPPRLHLDRKSTEETRASTSSKRCYENSDSESDSDVTQNKKPKTAFDALTNEAQDDLINQLVESVDDVNSRINRIMEANGLTMRDLQRRSNRECEPSTSKGNSLTNCNNNNNNNLLPNSTSSIRTESMDMPSCSKTGNLDREKNAQNCEGEGSHGNTSNNRSIPIIDRGNDNRRQYSPERNVDRRVQILPRYVQPGDPERWRTKWKIPLRRLSLRGYRKISDFTLNYLKNLDIDLIDLTYTSVTKIGIEHFLVHNPNCRVIHPSYCICQPKNPLF